MTKFVGKVSTAEAVVNFFKKQLGNGTLTPGDQLPSERELQDQLGISRFSLREGLARLSALGIVRVVHGKGAFVCEEPDAARLQDVMLPWFSSKNDKQIEDLIEARLVIEREVAVLAAQRRTALQVRDLTAILNETERKLDNPEAFGELDLKFHIQIAIIAGNAFFEKMLGGMHEHMRSFLLLHAKSTAARKKALAEHTEIVAAINKSDVVSIGSLVERHIVGCKKNYELTTRRTLGPAGKDLSYS